MFSFFRRNKPSKGGDQQRPTEAVKCGPVEQRGSDRPTSDAGSELHNGVGRDGGDSSPPVASRTGKEVVNLLLPEDSVRYNKPPPSRTGVQGLFDRMAKGRRRNKPWAFKPKERTPPTTASDKIDLNSNVFANLSDGGISMSTLNVDNDLRQGERPSRRAPPTESGDDGGFGAEVEDWPLTSNGGNEANARYFEDQSVEKRDTDNKFDPSGEDDFLECCEDLILPSVLAEVERMGAADSKSKDGTKQQQQQTQHRRSSDPLPFVDTLGDAMTSTLAQPSYVQGSLSLEVIKPNGLTKPLILLEPEPSPSAKLKNILKEENTFESSFEKPSSLKKHVTFHSFIEFDDGDKVEDEPTADDDTFTSFDDEEEDENGVFQLDVDNDDDDDDQSNAIVEFEDTSSSSEEIGYSPLKEETSGGVVIKELDIEEDAASDDTDSEDLVVPCVVEAAEPPKEVYIKIELEQDPEPILPEPKQAPPPPPVPSPKKEYIIPIVLEDTSSEEIEEVEEEEEEEEVEDEEEVEEEEEEEEVSSSFDEETTSEDQKCIKDTVSDDGAKDALITSELNNNNNNKNLINAWLSYKYGDKEEEDCAYTSLLNVLEKQMRGLVGQDERLSDLQERAAALHRVQSEVCNARKEAELVRQKLWHVEADLAATRCRNSQLLEQLEARTEDAKAAETKIQELTDKTALLQELLDKLIPEHEQLKEKYRILKAERDEERKIIEETLMQQDSEREAREEWWKAEFEKLRSQGAEREELLLADCEWKLREVQQSAREKGALAEQRLKDLQRQADERCAKADSQLAELSELSTLQAEVASLRQQAREQARALRLAGERASHAAQAESEASRLRALLDREKTALGTVKAQYAKDLEERENRLIERLQEQATRLEREWKDQYETAEQERRVKEQEESCKVHESIIKDAYDRLEMLKATLAKKEAQYAENLEREKARTDWEVVELRRLIDKTEIKHAEAIEALEEEHARETDRINSEMESKVKELETALSTQSVSARTTLELVKGQMKYEHVETMQKLKEKHKSDMEKQWDIFVADKEECLERMKAECILEGQEDREKRDKELLEDIETLKSDLSNQESDLTKFKHEARKATESKIIAEKKLSELQIACEQREMAVRSEVTRQAEVKEREARETIEHLTKKCACLTSLFEDMRSRWQQAPGEAAQLRKALQDEKAKSAALRRQLDALSRPYQQQKQWKL